VEVAQVVKAD